MVTTKQRLTNRTDSLSKFFVLALATVSGFAVPYFFGSSAVLAKSRSHATYNNASIIAPNLTLSPASQNLSKGSTLTVAVWENSSNTLVNAVQANLSYPANLLNYVSIDSTGSAFAIDAQGVGGNGTIRIAKGAIIPVSGKQFVANVNFKTCANRGKAMVNFSSGSMLLSSTTNSDILAATYGGNYTLTR